MLMRLKLSRCFVTLVVCAFGATAAAKDTSGGPPAAATAAPGGPPAGRAMAIEAGAPAGQVLKLRGADAKQQLLATVACDHDVVRDLTREMSWESSPAGIVSVTRDGVVTPLANGSATITA